VNNDHTIVTLEQYLKQAEQPLSFLFRGVTRSDAHTLIPSVARDWKEDTFPLLNLEERLLADFKRRALPWLTLFHPRNEWEWMMLAQHHGVPTRLLDWTKNPLTALFWNHPNRLSEGAQSRRRGARDPRKKTASAAKSSCRSKPPA